MQHLCPENELHALVMGLFFSQPWSAYNWSMTSHIQKYKKNPKLTPPRPGGPGGPGGPGIPGWPGIPSLPGGPGRPCRWGARERKTDRRGQAQESE